MIENQEILSRSAFARAINLSAARVTQLVNEGVIDGDVLVGSGRDSKIRAEIAKQQIKDRTDLSQRLGNGLKADLEGMSGKDVLPRMPSLADKLGEEKLEQAQIETRKRRREELASDGLYMLTSDVDANMARLCNDVVQIFEGGLADIAGALASNFDVAERDMLHSLRAEFRKTRERAAKKYEIATENTERLVGHDDQQAEINRLRD